MGPNAGRSPDHRFLVGRDGELADLARRWRSVRAGRGAVLVVQGPAGIGKTTLLLAAAEAAAADDCRPLVARAADAERDFAFGVARQLLEPPLLEPPAERRSRLLADAASVAGQVLDWRPAASSPPRLDTYAALHGLFRLTANLAEQRPLFVAVDNVEQADPPSLRWLGYLARRVAQLPVLVVLTWCPGRAASDAALLTDLTGLAGQLSLRGLGRTDAARLVADGFGGQRVGEAFAAACHTATGGNPFLLGELVRALAATEVRPTDEAAGRVKAFRSDELARRVLAQLRGQPAALVALARALAALGAADLEVDLELAASVAGLSPPAARAAASALSGLGILRQTARPTFAHAIVHQAVSQDLSAEDTELAHARAAEYLHRTGAEAERVAAQLLRSRSVTGAWLVPVLTEASSSAASRGAPEVAAGYLRRALREPVPAAVGNELTAQLGMIELNVDPRAALDRLTEAYTATGEPARRADIAVVLATELTERERYAEAAAVLDEVRWQAEPVDPDLAQRLELCALCATMAESYTQTSVSDRLARLRGHDRLHPDAERLVGTIEAFHAAVGGADGAAAAKLALRAWRQRIGARRLRGTQWDLTAAWEFAYLVAALLLTERLDLAGRYCADLGADLRRRGLSLWMAAAGALAAQVDVRRGALDAAQAGALAAIDALDGVTTGTRSATLFAVATLVDVLIERGQPEAASRLLDDRGLCGDLPPTWRYDYLLVSRGRLAIALRQWRAALDDLNEYGRRLAGRGMTGRAPHPWRVYAALAHAGLGDHAEAAGLVEREVALQRAWGLAGALGTTLRLAARVVPADRVVSYLVEAEATLAGSGFRLEHAWACAELGVALGERDRAAAQAHTRAALRFAEEHGALALAEWVGGEPAARSRPSVVSGLTPHERRIADLAVRGLTNRQIAESFTVTQRTVEMHLTRIYRKLGIARRSQLALALHRTSRP